jgi:hypothetical protein
MGKIDDGRANQISQAYGSINGEAQRHGLDLAEYQKGNSQMSDKPTIEMECAGEAGGEPFYEVALDAKTIPTRRAEPDPACET